MSYNIAIDGPAGAGKSTIARRLASRLGFLYVDTGAMYRAMAWSFLCMDLTEKDKKEMAQAAGRLRIRLAHTDEGQQVFVDGENVTPHLRTEEVGNMASVCSAIPEVRQALLALQKELAKKNDVVMDGRDIGTNILPQADLKIYLTASVQTRAKRRFLELTAKGESPSLSQIEEDIRARDERDMSRSVAPLRQAPDACLIDSSYMDIEQVVDAILALMEKKAV